MATVGIECVGCLCLVHKRGKGDCKKIPNPRLEMTLALQKSRQARYCRRRLSTFCYTFSSHQLCIAMVLAVSARTRILWGHAPRVRSAILVRRSFATVSESTVA
jgi:hypothetical protein